MLQKGLAGRGKASLQPERFMDLSGACRTRYITTAMKTSEGVCNPAVWICWFAIDIGKRLRLSIPAVLLSQMSTNVEVNDVKTGPLPRPTSRTLFVKHWMLSLAVLVVLLLAMSQSSMCAVPYRGYVFDFWQKPTPAPEAYLPYKVIDGRSIGISDFRAPQDIFVDDHLRVYLLDSGNNRIICMNQDWDVLRIIDQFEHDGKVDRFNSPKGLFVTSDGNIYVADTGNGRIVILTNDGKYIREIGKPTTGAEGIITEDFSFKPSKVAVDRAMRVFVKADEVFEGFMEFDSAGNFKGFVGAPRVAPSLLDVFWQRLATREQRERLALFLPTEFSNLDIDSRGFIMATTRPESVYQEDVVRRLSASGQDVLRRLGFTPPIGDVVDPSAWEGASISGPSVFVDVVASKDGVYRVLDQRRGRVFTYDYNGRLLYVFGGPGSQRGTLSTPVAIDVLGDEVVVLDSSNNRITVYAPTEYAKLIHAAIRLYAAGHYEVAAEVWRRVLAYNANYDLAYTGIGEVLLRTGDYREAMHYFRLGNNRDRYSEALGFYREEIIRENFATIMTVAVLAIALLYITVRLRLVLRLIKLVWPARTEDAGAVEDSPGPDKGQTGQSILQRLRMSARETARGLRYALHVIFSPFDGFWDLKHEKRGNLPAATIITILACFTYVFMRQYAGFPFNYSNPRTLNILLEIGSVLVPLALWCLVNWALTTLMDGKGTLREIFIATAYALTPVILINIPATILSNFMTVEEGAFYVLLIAISMVWALGLLFIGTMVTHDYTALKTAITSISVLVGIGFTLFIGLLFFCVVDVIVRFATDIYTEVAFRL